jgi:hypothetical protein
MSAFRFEKLFGIDVPDGLGLSVPDSPIPYWRYWFSFGWRIVVWLVVTITHLTTHRAVF